MLVVRRWGALAARSLLQTLCVPVAGVGFGWVSVVVPWIGLGMLVSYAFWVIRCGMAGRSKHNLMQFRALAVVAAVALCWIFLLGVGAGVLLAGGRGTPYIMLRPFLDGVVAWFVLQLGVGYRMAGMERWKPTRRRTNAH